MKLKRKFNFNSMMTSRLVQNLIAVRPTHIMTKTNRAVSHFWMKDLKGFRLKSLRRKTKLSGQVDQDDDSYDEEGGTQVRKKKVTDEKDEEFMKLTCNILKYLCRLNILPYVWDANSHQMLSHKSRIYIYLWLFTVPIVSLTNFLFVLFRFGQVLLHNFRAVQKNELSSIIPIWSALAFRSFVAVMTYSVLKHMKNVLFFTNQLMRFRKSDGRAALRRDFPACKIMTVIILLRTCQLIVTGCTKATRPQFVYSLLPVAWRNYYIYFIYVAFTVTANLTSLILIYYAAFPLTLVDTLETILNSKFTPFTPPKVKLLMFKQLHILLAQFHDCVGTLSMNYLKCYTLLISTTCAFGCVRFYDDLDFRVYVTMPISLISLIAFGYEWYGRSGKVPLLSQAAMKHMFDSRHEGNNRRLVYENRACLYSCRKLIVAKIKRHTFPSIVKFVCLQTIRMLIVSSRK